jgi:C4-dicarboxylate-specific signal transduction histidine kinase
VGLKVSLVRDAAGVVVHSRAVWRDITRRKRAEEALRQSEVQLRQASKLAAVGQLAAGVAHEINNPLTVVLGQAECWSRRA